MQRVEIMGTPVDLVNLEQTLAWIEETIAQPQPHCRQIITTNPEAVVRAQTDPALKKALLECELITADGVGIVWAVGQLTRHKLADRVPGSEILPAAFERFGPRLRVYFLGAAPGVARRAAEAALARWNIQVCGVQDGYFKEEAAVVTAIQQAQPDLLVVGMGERQDTFIHRNKARLGAKVAIGVGGMIDVLAGEVKRAPAWAQRLKIEWLVRIASDRKRWGRFPRLLQFVRLVWASKRQLRFTQARRTK